MDNRRESIGDTVKQFLSGNLSASSSRAEVVFDQVSVEGSGRGVSAIHAIYYQWISPSVRIDNPLLNQLIQPPGSSSTHRLDQNRVMDQLRQSADIPHA